jgi:threonine/homoserine/homoserine lactone efflux protein
MSAGEAVLWGDLAIAFAVYAVATASPGPATLAIMGSALAEGRARALALAGGVMAGSVAWGLAAAFGLAVVLHEIAWALVALKIAGGLYLLWLALRAARSALRPGPPPVPRRGRGPAFRIGLGIHLTNPKAVLSWAAIMAIGLPAEAGAAHLALLLGGCAGLGALIFGGYAVAFSAPPLARGYARARRAVEAALAVLFGAAGIRLIAGREAVAP